MYSASFTLFSLATSMISTFSQSTILPGVFFCCVHFFVVLLLPHVHAQGVTQALYTVDDLFIFAICYIRHTSYAKLIAGRGHDLNVSEHEAYRLWA